MSEVVTGDAVVLEVRVAQMASRAVAVLIDMVVQLVLMVGGILLLVNFAPISDSAMLVASSILLSVLVMVGYPVIFETASRGAASASWRSGCGWSVRTAGPSGSGRRCSAGWRGWWSSGCSTGLLR